MSKQRVITVFASSVLLLVLALSTLAMGEAAVITLKYSDINSPVSNNAKFAEKFASLTKEKTQGRVIIDVYMAKTLAGYDIEAARSGIADFVQMVPSVVHDLEPSTSILDAPYIYKDLEHLLKVVHPNSPIVAKINEGLTKKGVRMLGGWSLGDRQMTTNKAIYKPSDLKGLKLRVVPSVVYDAIITAFGATTTPMAFGEVATALLTNVIDGQENPYSTIYSNKFHEIQKYVIETNHLTTIAGIFMNEKSYQKLPEQDKELLKEAFAEASRWISYDVKNQQETAKQAIIASGKCTVITKDNGLDYQAFTAIGLKVRDRFISEWGSLYDQIVSMGK